MSAHVGAVTRSEINLSGPEQKDMTAVAHGHESLEAGTRRKQPTAAHIHLSPRQVHVFIYNCFRCVNHVMVSSHIAEQFNTRI